MSDPGIGQYRREVIATTDCPDCYVRATFPCRKIAKGNWHGEDITYVHDGRSHRHHVCTLATHVGTENPF